MAKLKFGRIEIAQVFELVVQARAPAAVRGREADRLESRAPENPMGTLQVDAIGLGLAINVMEMPVRLRVVPPQVGEDRRMVGISIRAHKVSATPVQRSTGRGEAVVVFRHGLVEVGTKAEGRAIRIRKGGQPDPDAPCTE